MNKYSFELAKCSTHNLYYQYICCNAQCVNLPNLCKICQQAHNSHSQTVYKITDLVNKIKKNVVNITKGINGSNDQHQTLMSICSQVISKLKKEQDSVLERVLGRLQNQQSEIERKIGCLQKDQKNINKIIKVYQYFKELKEKNLIQIKIKTLSGKGLRKFKAKKSILNRSKDILGQIQTAQNEFKIQLHFQQKIQNLIELYSSVKNMKNTTKTNDTSKKSREKSNEKPKSPQKINNK